MYNNNGIYSTSGEIGKTRLFNRPLLTRLASLLVRLLLIYIWWSFEAAQKEIVLYLKEKRSTTSTNNEITVINLSHSSTSIRTSKERKRVAISSNPQYVPFG